MTPEMATKPEQETETTMVIEQTGLIRRRSPGDVVLMPVMDMGLARQRLTELQEFCANYLEESNDGGTDGGDFGVIPGAGKKKVLFKSGAEKLCDVYGLADRYTILSKVEDFDNGLFDYTIQCELVRKTDEMFVGSGLGSCSSYESKYRWRDSKRTCPSCGKDTIIKGKAEYGGGWLCWANRGGCGEKFKDGDKAIEGQVLGRIQNPDIADTKNTVLKIAKKRAKIDAVISVTRSSGIFTQDLDEHEIAAEVKTVEPKAEVKTATMNTVATSIPQQKPVQAAQTTAAPPPANETHTQKIARIKAEAAAKATPPPAAGKETMPHATGGVVRGAGPVDSSVADPQPTSKTIATAPVEAATAVAAPAVKEQPTDGSVFITAINVRNGPMVMKDGKSQPSWGPLYIVAFSQKVKASDGTMVADASTFNEKDAALAEQARDAGQSLKPVLEPGTKKGSYKLVRFE